MPAFCLLYLPQAAASSLEAGVHESSSELSDIAEVDEEEDGMGSRDRTPQGTPRHTPRVSDERLFTMPIELGMWPLDIGL